MIDSIRRKLLGYKSSTFLQILTIIKYKISRRDGEK